MFLTAQPTPICLRIPLLLFQYFVHTPPEVSLFSLPDCSIPLRHSHHGPFHCSSLRLQTRICCSAKCCWTNKSHDMKPFPCFPLAILPALIHCSSSRSPTLTAALTMPASPTLPTFTSLGRATRCALDCLPRHQMAP